MEKSVLEKHIENGLSVRKIAVYERRSYSTVRHWLKKYGLKTLFNSPDKVKETSPTVEKECKIHGLTTYAKRADGRYRCRKCSVEAVQKRREKVKKLLVEYKGGRCERCGIETHPSVYEFHHKEPSKKDFGIGDMGYTSSLDKNKKEVDKCMMLCANCHRLKHAGVW